MIKQYVLSIESEEEHYIDMFIQMLNKQADAVKDVSPIQIHVEEQKL